MPVAIITGSASGIGRAVALRLARDGFKVVIADIESQQANIDSAVREVIAMGQEAHGVIADVSITDQVEAMVTETVKVFGELNVMVANAGILDTTGVLDMTLEKWNRTMSVNVGGVFLCHSAAARQMIKQGKGGKLIAACSISGYRPSGKCPAYCSSKWAVRGFTQSCAIELGPYGITVNAYCPGTVPTTNMSLQFATKLENKKGVSEQDTTEEPKPSHGNALDQEVKTDDIAGLVSFLAGKDSGRITGQSMICDGGEVLPRTPLICPLN